MSTAQRILDAYPATASRRYAATQEAAGTGTMTDSTFSESWTFADGSTLTLRHDANPGFEWLAEPAKEG